MIYHSGEIKHIVKVPKESTQILILRPVAMRVAAKTESQFKICGFIYASNSALESLQKDTARNDLNIQNQASSQNLAYV